MTRKPAKIPLQDWARWNPGLTGRFEGGDLDTGVTILAFCTATIGAGPRLHVHTYDELFLVRQGNARFTVGGEVIDATAGDIVFGPANVPHKFHNTGPGLLETTDIHLSPRFAQTDLHDPDLDHDAR